MKHLILILCFLFGKVGLLWAQDSTEQDLLKQKLALYKNELKNDAESHRLQFETTTQELVRELKDETTFNRILLVTAGGVSVVAFFSALIGIYLNARKMRFSLEKHFSDRLRTWVDQEYPQMTAQELKRIFDEDNLPLEHAIESKRLESKLRKSFPIRVIYQGEEGLKAAREELEDIHQYQQIQFNTVEEYKTLRKEGELILVYSLTGGLLEDDQSKRAVEELIHDEISRWKEDRAQNIFVVATLGYLKPIQGEDVRSICNLANSHFVLDSRIMESLTYWVKRLNQKGQSPFPI